MRKLKLQMVVTIDGFGLVPSDKGETNFSWDDQVNDFCIENLEDVDNIVLGRTTADGFIPYWAVVANNPDDKMYDIGKPLTDIPKIVFSSRPANAEWTNATVMSGDITTEIQKLKKQNGKNMIVYGGNSFVSSLVKNDLIDEYYLLMQPIMTGGGQTFIPNLQNGRVMNLKESRQFPCGTILLCYEKK